MQRRAGKEARTAFELAVSRDGAVDALDEQVGQGDVDLVALAQIGSHVDLDCGPHPAGIVGIRQVLLDSAG